MVQRTNRRNHLLSRLERIDLCQLHRHRLQAKHINRRRIHARSKIVTHLLLNPRTLCRLRIGLKNPPQKLLILIPQLRINAPARLVSRNRILLLPTPAGKLVEVHARIHRPVQTRYIQRRRIGHRLKRLRRRLLCGKTKSRKQERRGRQRGQTLPRHRFSRTHNPNRKPTHRRQKYRT